MPSRSTQNGVQKGVLGSARLSRSSAPLRSISRRLKISSCSRCNHFWHSLAVESTMGARLLLLFCALATVSFVASTCFQETTE